jgi:hypothetical protein
MPDDPAGEVTAVLRAFQGGDQDEAARLLRLVHAELRKLVQARLVSSGRQRTLQPTSLVHEAYLRLLGKTELPVESRRHFVFAAARAMRDILVENARSKARQRRGGGRQRVELKEIVAPSGPPLEGPARPSGLLSLRRVAIAAPANCLDSLLMRCEFGAKCLDVSVYRPFVYWCLEDALDRFGSAESSARLCHQDSKEPTLRGREDHFPVANDEALVHEPEVRVF